MYRTIEDIHHCRKWSALMTPFYMESRQYYDNAELMDTKYLIS